jgi:hypothetical protein
VALLIGLLALQVMTGLFAVDIDGLESGPLSYLVDFDQGRTVAEIHEFSFNALLALVALHVRPGARWHPRSGPFGVWTSDHHEAGGRSSPGSIAWRSPRGLPSRWNTGGSSPFSGDKLQSVWLEAV